MMDAQANWSDRTDEAMEQSIVNEKLTTNSDQGAALPASPSSKIYSEEFFAVNFSMTGRAIQGRNAYAAWARKIGTTKKGDPEFLRVHEELRKSGENIDKVLSQMGNIPLLKLPASEKELDQLVENYKNPIKSQEDAEPKVVSTPSKQDRPESAPQGKKSTKRTRDSEGFISPLSTSLGKLLRLPLTLIALTTPQHQILMSTSISLTRWWLLHPPNLQKSPPFSLTRRGIGER
ncbi:hypothetical protein NPIL_292301 [Nephila pilipes]|uniref:Uncharacterized protein n=1 Tax=Nephila pilipes TaxID=299642 RepID=A0A8X6T4S3_NEPPI|nr:hypothetical protein NPIL_292301 [Nephila pilipes]